MSSPAVRSVFQLAYLVSDYDEARDWFKDKLDFQVFEDSDFGGGRRWITVGPKEQNSFSLLLRLANEEEKQNNLVGHQAGDRVFLFLSTDDFTRDYDLYKSNGVKFLESPRHEPYGNVAVFQDLYGNKWDLIQKKNISK
jgi:hypothetical protein